MYCVLLLFVLGGVAVCTLCVCVLLLLCVLWLTVVCTAMLLCILCAMNKPFPLICVLSTFLCVSP